MRAQSNENGAEQSSKAPKKQGDWTCLQCNNLNYSFRDTCNRCKTMTRQQNLLLSKTYEKEATQSRSVLGELSLNRHSSMQETTGAFPKLQQLCSHSVATLKSIQMEHLVVPGPFLFENFGKPLQWPLKGFSSLVLLTPTRCIKQGWEDDEPEQKDWKSPLRPDMSPLLRALKDQINLRV